MIKVNLKINRRELADKTYGNATTVVTGEAKPLPDEARLIAELINKFLIKQEGI